MTGLSLPPVGPGQADGPAPALSPDSFFQELLGTFNNPSGGIQAAGAIGVAAATAAPTGIGDELWSSNGTNEWSWMNDIGMFGVTPSSAPGPSQ
ncbi:hypothetical protein FRB99_005987 [Tulasnella sp. 403]|nr:hypothetical protein FRB99_005987 [Tulasnella sp. 403]